MCGSKASGPCAGGVCKGVKQSGIGDSLAAVFRVHDV